MFFCYVGRIILSNYKRLDSYFCFWVKIPIKIILIFIFLSSSVRRTSFRDKEKAARKLDTSFKDVLYASENQIAEHAVSIVYILSKCGTDKLRF